MADCQFDYCEVDCSYYEDDELNAECMAECQFLDYDYDEEPNDDSDGEY